MAIIPSGGAYPGIINEAQLLAAAAADIAAAKAAAVPDAATIAALVAPAQSDAGTISALVSPAQSDAGTIAALVAPAQSDAGTIAALVAPAQSDAGTIAALVEPAQGDASTIAALVAPSQGDAGTIAALVSPAQADAAAADAARIAAEAAAAAAGNANKVATDDARLGLRGGIALLSGDANCAASPVASTLTASAFTAVAEFVVPSGAANSAIMGTVGTATGWVAVAMSTGLKITSNSGFSVGGTWIGGNWTPFSTPLNDGKPHHVAVIATETTMTVVLDGVTSAVAAVGALPVPTVSVGSGMGTYAASGTVVRKFARFNYALTVTDIASLLRGEYPQAWLGGSGQIATSAAWADNGWTSVSGATLTPSGASVTAYSPTSNAAASSVIRMHPWASGTSVPSIRPGRVFRVWYSLTGAATANVRLTLYCSVTGGAITQTPVAGSGYLDFTSTVSVVSPSFGIMSVGAADFTLSITSVEVLGAQVLVGPQDWTLSRGVDMSGNANDLIFGVGVRAIDPASKIRVFKLTTNGTAATPATGTIGDVGTTYSGQTYRDSKALAAVRAGDFAAANWAAARPANSYGLTAVAPSNGTLTLQTLAVGGNVSVANGSVINISHSLTS